MSVESLFRDSFQKGSFQCLPLEYESRDFWGTAAGNFRIGLMALLFPGDSGDQDFKRIGKLEAQIEDLQKQVKELRSQVKALESKPIYRFAAPDTRLPGNQIPPGAKRYSYNGQNFWLVPVSPDPKS